MINQNTIQRCREFIFNPQEKRREVTMGLKISIGRNRSYYEIGERLSQLKPFIDYIYQDITRLYESNSAFYNHCNISRQVFSKMQEANYDPTKETMYKILIGLNLSIMDAVILMENAGYTFTYKNNTQLIIIFCILNEIYNTEDVDTLLSEFGEETLFSQT